MAYVLHPLKTGLSAEIIGLDLRTRLSDITLAELLDHWHGHPLLVFRNQQLGERDLLAFGRRLGVAGPRDETSDAVAGLLYAPKAASGDSWFEAKGFEAGEVRLHHAWQSGDLLLWDTARLTYQRDGAELLTLHHAQLSRLYTAWERLSAYA